MLHVSSPHNSVFLTAILAALSLLTPVLGNSPFTVNNFLQCSTKQKCPDISQWKLDSVKYLQPAISGRWCTALIFTNMAKPEWLSVRCNDKKLNSILCSTNMSFNQVQVQSNSSELFCPIEQVFKDNNCLKMTVFTKSCSDIKFSTKVRFQQSLLHHFLFLIGTIKGQFHSVLTVNNTGFCRIVSFYKYTQKAIHKREWYFHLKQSGEPPPLLLQLSAPLVPPKGGNRFLCKANIYLSSFLVCDGEFDCGPGDHSDEELSLCNQISNVSADVNKYFGREGKVFLPRNISSHALNNSDLDAINSTFLCNESGISIPLSAVNDLIPDCGLDAEDEAQLMLILMAENSNQSFSYKRGKPNHCLNHGQLSCREGHFRCFFPYEICIYNMNMYNHLLPCRNGAHLMECIQFECNAMFKCSDSYCIPWHYVCNNRWDCPKGEEESSVCSGNMYCVGKFHCVQSEVCVHLGKFCDEQADCPNKDDELLCSVAQSTCPVSCACVRFVVVCQMLSQPMSSNSYAFLFLVIHKSITFLDVNIFQNFESLQYLQVHNSALEEVCSNQYPLELHFVDFKNNRIQLIQSKCFGFLKTLQILCLDHNKISAIDCDGFVNLVELQVLNISYNPLHRVSAPLLHDFNNLKVLSILSHSNDFVTHNVLINVTVLLLEVSQYHMCCFKHQQTKCSKQSVWYESCSDLLPSESLQSLYILISVLVSVHIFSFCIFQFYTQKRNPKEYNKAIWFLIGNYCLHAVYLVMILGIDIYNPDVPVVKLNAIHMKLCYSAFTCILWFSLQSGPFLVILCYLRYSVVVHPIKNLGKVNFFSLQKLYTLTCVVCFGFSITFSVLVFMNSALPINLCSPHLNPTKGDSFTAFTLFNACENIICSFAVLTFNIQLVKSLKTSQKFFMERKIKKGHKSNGRTHVFLHVQLFLITLSCFLSLWPLHISGIAVLFMDQFPTALTYYLPIMSFPIQSLVIPTVLAISALKNL